jgi:hypothetical protein
MSVDHELIALCGIHCEPCPLYRARTDEALRESLAQRLGTPAEVTRCEGCRPTAGSPMPLRGEVCPTYTCHEDKKHEFCHECDEFPCRLLHPTAERAAVLPHNTKLMSLLVMKRDGIESWAKQYPTIQRRYFEGKLVIGHGPSLPDDVECGEP